MNCLYWLLTIACDLVRCSMASSRLDFFSSGGLLGSGKHVAYLSMQNLGGYSIPDNDMVHVNFSAATYNHPCIKLIMWSRAQRGF